MSSTTVQQPDVFDKASVSNHSSYISVAGPTVSRISNNGWYSARTEQSFTKGVCEFEVTISSLISASLCIGVVPYNLDISSGQGSYFVGGDHGWGWGLYGNGTTYMNGSANNYINNRTTFANGTRVNVCMDFNKHTLRYEVNGVDMGVVSHVHLEGPVYGAVSLYQAGQVVTITSSRRSYIEDEIKTKQAAAAEEEKRLSATIKEPNDFRTETLWKRRVKELQDVRDLPRINILIVGEIGSGKSSFINTIMTAFNDDERISDHALAHGSQKGHISTDIRHYRLPGTNIVLWDAWGWTGDNYNQSEFPYLLDGHLQSGFKMGEIPRPEAPRFKRSPELEDRVHNAIMVLDASQTKGSTSYAKRVSQFREDLHARDYRPLVVLNKLDKLDTKIAEDASTVYSSHACKKERIAVSDSTGFRIGDIFPTKLYTSEMDRNKILENGPLIALWNAVSSARSFIRQKAPLYAKSEAKSKPKSTGKTGSATTSWSETEGEVSLDDLSD